MEKFWKYISLFEKTGIDIDGAKLFDQTVGTKTVQEKQINKWNYMEFCYEKWTNVIKNYDSCEQYSELLKLCQ